MDQLQILYVSSATDPDSVPDIQGILAESRRNNARAGITGMLLYCDGNFLQILEGPAAAVETTMQRILRDRRLTSVRVLLRQSVTSRVFAGWSMGFERMERNGLPGSGAVFEISRKAIEGRMTDVESWPIRHFMKTFYRINTRADLPFRTRT